MAENIYIDLTEEIEDDLRSRYEQLSQDLTDVLSGVRDGATEICEKTSYEPMVNLINDITEKFNDEIRNDYSTRAFDEWCDGEGSFSAIVENSYAGDAAAETARNLEAAIRGIFDDFWSSQPPGDTILVDTSRPIINSEDYVELKEVYMHAFDDITKIEEECTSSIASEGDENPTYNVILPAIQALVHPITVFFEGLAQKIEEAQSQSDELKSQQDQKNDEAVQTATTTTASVEQIADALAMFANL